MTSLAIVLPYYKRDFIEHTLQSLVIQTCKNFVVYIGDDHSPFSLIPIVEKYQKDLDISYKRYSQNLGKNTLTKQWERCVKMAEDEEWFIILGDDDYLAKNAVEKFYEALRFFPDCEVFRYKTQRIDENNHKIGELQSYSKVLDSKEFQSQNAQFKVRSSLSEYIYKIETFKKIGIKEYDSGFYSDNWMFLNYSKFGIIREVDAEAYIRYSNKNLSGNNINHVDKDRAGEKFYFDLVYNDGHLFSRAQKKTFLPYIRRGFIMNTFKLTARNSIKMLKENFSFQDNVLTVIKVLKHKLFR